MVDVAIFALECLFPVVNPSSHVRYIIHGELGETVELPMNSRNLSNRLSLKVQYEAQDIIGSISGSRSG